MKMNNDNLIFLYLDNQMSDNERLKFEERLKNSPELKAQFQQIKMNLDNLKSAPLPETEDYFNNLIPLFRQNMESKQKKEKSFIPKFASYASLAVIMVVLLFVYIMNKESADNHIAEYTDYNLTELEVILSEYLHSDDISLVPEMTDMEFSDRVDSIITENYLFAAGIYFDYNSAIKSLSDEDADIIYTQLINKDIISGEL
jgi:hypothetical protein